VLVDDERIKREQKQEKRAADSNKLAAIASAATPVSLVNTTAVDDNATDTEDNVEEVDDVEDVVEIEDSVDELDDDEDVPSPERKRTRSSASRNRSSTEPVRKRHMVESEQTRVVSKWGKPALAHPANKPVVPMDRLKCESSIVEKSVSTGACLRPSVGMCTSVETRLALYLFKNQYSIKLLLFHKGFQFEIYF